MNWGSVRRMTSVLMAMALAVAALSIAIGKGYFTQDVTVDAPIEDAWGRPSRRPDLALQHSAYPAQVVDMLGEGRLEDVVAISVGAWSRVDKTIALKKDGTIFVWGYVHFSQFDYELEFSGSPVPVVDFVAMTRRIREGRDISAREWLTDIASVSAGSFFAVAVDDNGNAWGWGNNNSRSVPFSEEVVLESLRVESIPEGVDVARYVEQIREQVIGLLGAYRLKGPDEAAYLTEVVSISAGSRHALAIRYDGSVWSWGCNNFGKLGDGTREQQSSPVRVKRPGGEGFLEDVASISAGWNHTVAVKNDGTVWAWGWNGRGQLGNGSQVSSSTPVQVKGIGGVGYLADVVSVSAGNYHTVAVTKDGSVLAWGCNTGGKLGDGTATSSSTPVRVRGLENVIQASASGGHTTAVTKDGTAWAWGWNESNQLGDGTTESRSTPVQVRGQGGDGFLTDVASIASAWDHTVALKTDGTVWSWGTSKHGRLGNGTDDSE